MRGDKVPDEQENAHDDVFGDRDNIGSRNLEDLDTVLDGSVEINVI